jgi:hypothetical protein
MPKILFLGGPSGSGKSTFASDHLAPRGWRHIEIDRYPEGDGIDMENLRAPWDTFLNHHQPAPLHDELLRRGGDERYLVLTFPSHLIFGPQHIQVSRGRFFFAYLYGHPAFCLREFTTRERAAGRGLDSRHWDRYASDTFGGLALSSNHGLLIEAFTLDGTRRETEEMYRDVLHVIDEV